MSVCVNLRTAKQFKSKISAKFKNHVNEETVNEFSLPQNNDF